ncbi:MAG: hypothetical protein Q9N02_02415, partial [Ghiorsea sp.]|nr:hypothetical protein [Ghiorsea sp.]
SDTAGFGASANTSQVYVLRGTRTALGGDPHAASVALADRLNLPVKLEIYHLDSSSPEALLLADQFSLQARDVVYVSPTKLSRFSRVFLDISRIINTTAQTLILQRSYTR